MSAFVDLVDELWTCDQYTTADAIADRLELTRSQREYLIPVIVNSCRMVRRCAAKRVEDAYDPARCRSTVVVGDVPSVDPRLAFLATEFALPDGSYVSWGAATVVQHEARVVMLDKMRGSLADTIGKHETVIGQIRAANVRCLADLHAGGVA